MEMYIYIYLIISLGCAIGLGTEDDHANRSNHWAIVLIGSGILGLFWPVLWAAKITQRLNA
jgi:hypothetical protein